MIADMCTHKRHGFIALAVLRITSTGFTSSYDTNPLMQSLNQNTEDKQNCRDETYLGPHKAIKTARNQRTEHVTTNLYSIVDHGAVFYFKPPSHVLMPQKSE